MANQIDPRILELCKQVTAKRPRTVIDHIIEHGSITTEDLQITYGYDHPPRAVGDVRDQGIPIETDSVISTRTGRKIAIYRFGDPDNIIRGRIGGRKAFSKKFKSVLVKRYGSKDAFTGEECHARLLQIDHRVPYRVAGNTVFDEARPEEYMLLDASSQRAKSWSCEQCDNWNNVRNADLCRSCFWAFPEHYTHIAGKDVRRVHIEWQGDEVKVYERLRRCAENEETHISEHIKRLLRMVVEKR